MKRLLSSLAPAVVMACSLTPLGISSDAEEAPEPVAKYRMLGDSTDSDVDQAPAKPDTSNAIRTGKIARYNRSNPCMDIDTGDLKSTISAKMDCLMDLQ